jgi:hypothetical protein
MDPQVPEATQIFEPSVVIVKLPFIRFEASKIAMLNPSVAGVTENPVIPAIPPLVDEYPVVVYPPDPICTNKETELASMLTSLNIMVMRFTSDGNPVKLIAVPLVDAWAVEDLIKAELA